jgi:acyl-CoA synthetase (AMP-forming)/AMP-acid ligase II
MSLLLEMRLFSVRPGTRDTFHRISHEGTVPLMRRFGIHVLAYGPALNNDDTYYLLRAFTTEEQRKEQARILYASPEWENNFDAEVMGMIDDYRITVMPATPALVAELAAQPERPVATTARSA